MPKDTRAMEAIEHAQHVRSMRAPYESLLEDVAYYTAPERRGFNSTREVGDERHDHLYSAEGGQASERMAAQLQTLLVSPEVRWFGLSVLGAVADPSPDEWRWLRSVEDQIFAVLDSEQGRFYSSTHEAFMDAVLFGTCAMYMGGTFRMEFQSRPFAEIYLDTGRSDRVDTVVRAYRLTRRQAIQEFGEGASKSISFGEGRKKKPMGERLCFTHIVRPYQSGDPGFESLYICDDDEKIVAESRYTAFPYSVGRWSRAASERYGRGPGMRALPDVRMANSLGHDTILASQISVLPPVSLPDDGFVEPFDVSPGALNYFRADMEAIERPLQLGANAVLGTQFAERLDEKIRMHFYQDVLALPEVGRMTTEEVAERRSSKFTVVSPIVARFATEFITPILTRVFEHLKSRGLLPDAPESLRGQPLRIDYQSPMVRSRRVSSAVTTGQWVSTVVAQLAQMDPEVIDYVDTDAVARTSAYDLGVNPEVMRDDEEVARRRAARQQQQEQAAAIEAAQGLAGAARDAGVTSNG